MSERLATLFTVSLALFVCGFSRADAGDTFLESDEIEEGEAIVNVFLKDPDYALMLEDVERNGVELDWAWVLTPAPPPVEASGTAAPRGRLRRIFRSRSPKLDPRVLGFDLSQARTVNVPSVQNFAGVFPPDQLEMIRNSLLEAMRTLGLEPPADPTTADLELGIALVDHLRSQVDVPVYGIRVQPHIELELRLRDRRSDENLLLARHRKHGGNHQEAALNFADDLVRFLR
jgi:hypothetical protein